MKLFALSALSAVLALTALTYCDIVRQRRKKRSRALLLAGLSPSPRLGKCLHSLHHALTTQCRVEQGNAERS